MVKLLVLIIMLSAPNVLADNDGDIIINNKTKQPVKVTAFPPRGGVVVLRVKGFKDKPVKVVFEATESTRALVVYSYKPFVLGRFKPEQDKFGGKYRVSLSVGGGLSLTLVPGVENQVILIQSMMGLGR